ncbi:hypothetical protein [Paenibacillus odorifer]|uniref:hypothetical protein n=1 Tax=Paenibacillus odorifer TaxID=189426 RepID=UPI00096CADF1|nr:hypothetical protein [Paenibacillus odorifer]OMD08387.1 hypothetical protein BJP50_07295 [Paenibacillus odorifer]
MMAAWINLGTSYELVSEYGARVGTLITLDKQIHHRNLKSLYDPPIGFRVDKYKFIEKRLVKRISA